MHQSPAAALSAAFADAFLTLGLPVEWAVVQQSKPGNGFDFQCAGALRAGDAALDTAHALIGIVSTAPGVALAEVSGPGFVNVRLQADFLLGFEPVPAVDAPQNIVIDFGGPNIAKPLHVGHLRSLAIGESLRRILLAVGHHVVSDIHLGDWGLPMGQVIDAWRRTHPESSTAGGDLATPVSIDELERIYPVAAAECAADARRLAAAQETTARLQAGDTAAMTVWGSMREVSIEAAKGLTDVMGAHFDLWLGESDVAPRVEALVVRALQWNIAVESRGAIVVPVAIPEDGARPMPPLILRKTDGSSTYATTDVATLEARMEAGAERVIYVVDRRQTDHFVQLTRAAERLGIATANQVVHIGFGTVNGADGRPLRTRDGGVARLDVLVAGAIAAARDRMTDASEEDVVAVGVGALKFLDLSSPRGTGYVFDLERALSFEGDTGPYVQYAAVRISALLARAGGVAAGDPAAIGGAPAHELLLECARFPEAVTAALDECEPYRIAQQLLRIARAFSRFYAGAPIIGAADEENRLALCRLVRQRLGTGLDLLGIAVPNRM